MQRKFGQAARAARTRVSAGSWTASVLSVALVVQALTGCSEQKTPTVDTSAVGRRADPLFNNGGFESGSLAPDWTVRSFLNNNAGINSPPWPPATEANLDLS